VCRARGRCGKDDYARRSNAEADPSRFTWAGIARRGTGQEPFEYVERGERGGRWIRGTMRVREASSGSGIAVAVIAEFGDENLANGGGVVVFKILGGRQGAGSLLDGFVGEG